MNPEFPGVNLYITTCLHGVDLRFTPRCYLCKPWPDDSPVWKVTSPGHVHEGEWCALCVEAGGEARELSEARASLDVELEAAAILLAKVIESMRKNDPAIFAAVLPHIHAFLDAYAREYVALEEPTP